MTALEPWLQHVVPFVLTAFRVGGLFVGAPIVSSQAMPRRFRALTAVMLAAAVYPALPPAAQAPSDLDLLGLAGLAAGELLIGVTIGAIAAIPLAGLSLGGYLMGHQMGLALARSFNPETNTESSAVDQLLYFLGLYTFIGVGGLEAMLIGVLNTFRRVPAGALAMTDAPLELVLQVLASSFELAIRVAAPVLATILMVLIAMGVLMKTMPQINILSVGFAIKILVGLTILSATLVAVEEVVHDELLHVLGGVLRWTRTAH